MAGLVTNSQSHGLGSESMHDLITQQQLARANRISAMVQQQQPEAEVADQYYVRAQPPYQVQPQMVNRPQ